MQLSMALGVGGDAAGLVLVVVGELRARRRGLSGRPAHLGLIKGALVLLGSAAAFFLAGTFSGAICITRGCVSSTHGSSFPLPGMICSVLAAVVFLAIYLATGTGRSR